MNLCHRNVFSGIMLMLMLFLVVGSEDAGTIAKDYADKTAREAAARLETKITALEATISKQQKQIDLLVSEVGPFNRAMYWGRILLISLGIITLLNLVGKPLMRIITAIILTRYTPNSRKIDTGDYDNGRPKSL